MNRRMSLNDERQAFSDQVGRSLDEKLERLLIQLIIQEFDGTMTPPLSLPFSRQSRARATWTAGKKPTPRTAGTASPATPPTTTCGSPETREDGGRKSLTFIRKLGKFVKGSSKEH